MKAVVVILTYYFLLTGTVFGQTNTYSGKTFVNEKLDQIDFINDTVLIASFRTFPAKYELQKDSFTLTLLHHHIDMDLRHSYRLLRQSADTLTFIYTSLYSKPDTMQFVNIQNRIVPVTTLGFLSVNVYGYMGDKQLIINSNRTVKYVDKSSTKASTFKLSFKQYNELLDMLSKSLIFMLPAKRSVDGEDVTFVDFKIRANNKTIVSTGANLSKVHAKLFKYLFNAIAQPN